MVLWAFPYRVSSVCHAKSYKLFHRVYFCFTQAQGMKPFSELPRKQGLHLLTDASQSLLQEMSAMRNFFLHDPLNWPLSPHKHPVNASGGVYSSVLTCSHNKHNLNYINHLCDGIFLCKTSGDLIVLPYWNFSTELKQINYTWKSTSGKWEDNMCTYQHISCVSRLLNLLYQGQLALLNINAELCIIWGFSYSEDLWTANKNKH